MAKLNLTIACGDYDRTRALMDGTVKVEGVDLNYLALGPSEVFWRMLNNEEFDASEMSLSSYTILRSEGDDRFIAIPVFPSRIFRHSCLYVRRDSGIEKPQDLKGRRIGVGDYQMTAAVWVRGFLEHEYQVTPGEMRWLVGQPVREIKGPEDVEIQSMVQGESLDRLLDEGEIDALISVVLPPSFLAGSRNIKRMFPDFRQVESDYFERTGIFPIMHTFVIKTGLYEENPWLAVSLYKAFVQARDLNYRRIYDPNALKASLPWLIDDIEKARKIFGPNIWDYSVKGSRPTLEAFVQYMSEQGLSRRPMQVQELFASNIQEERNQYLDAIGEEH